MKIAIISALLLTFTLAAERIVYSANGGKIKSFDPILADDSASQKIVGSLYDTLLQYDYIARPYKLIPSMLSCMPRFSPDFRSCRFTLRRDLRFADDPAFAGAQGERNIRVKDVFYSLKRICDPRNASPVYWILRGKIAGMEQFREAARKAAKDDDHPYDLPVKGMIAHNDYEFTLLFNQPEPRLLYLLAMPNAGIVSRRAVQYYGEKLTRHPVGSGPFTMQEHIADYKLVLKRNPDYRKEFFAQAENPADRTHPLPLADKVVIYSVKQPITAWMLFLQGRLDFHAVGKDDADLLAGGKLPLALQKRGVRLLSNPSFEVIYIGFNCDDPVIGKNKKLRQALSLAYNVKKRIEHANFQLLRADSPIPPGVAGYDSKWRNPYSEDNPEKARTMIQQAGGTGVHLTLDLVGEGTSHRQIAELTAAEFKAAGVELETVFNMKPRFFAKLRQGKMQLFRLSWVGDYPDMENFLQLFYSGNAGSCNRCNFRNAEFDRLYLRIAAMGECPERLELCRKATKLLCEESPWIFEGYPVYFQLLNPWIENFHPHDFAFSQMKYLTANPEKREKMRRTFRPLNFSDLR